jgi:hypothetical protein
MPVIPGLGRLSQEDCKFGVSLGYISRLSQKKQRNLNIHTYVSKALKYLLVLKILPPKYVYTQ